MSGLVLVVVGIAIVVLIAVGLREYSYDPFAWPDDSPYAPPNVNGLTRGITEAEFLAAVPDANPETALKVRAIVSYQLDVPIDDIHPSDSFVDDLGAG